MVVLWAIDLTGIAGGASLEAVREEEEGTAGDDDVGTAWAATGQGATDREAKGNGC